MTYPNIQQALSRGTILPSEIEPLDVSAMWKQCECCQQRYFITDFKPSRHKGRIRSRSQVCRICEEAQAHCDRIGSVVDLYEGDKVAGQIRKLKTRGIEK